MISTQKTNQKLWIEDFGERKICIKGVGKLFYQDGYPISMSIFELKKQGVEVSIFHVADECLKNGWSAKTTYNKLKADFDEDIDKTNVYDLEKVKAFCWSDYETQREMIFQYLFKTTANEIRIGENKEPLKWAANLLQETESK